MKTTTQKNIFDYNHVKGTTAIVLLKNGEVVGRIVANWSDNPAGSVCTAQVMLWDGVISEQVRQVEYTSEFLKGSKHAVTMIGKAGGYGYDKLSSAIASALRVGGIDHLIKVQGGSGNQEQAFKEAGFQWFTVC